MVIRKQIDLERFIKEIDKVYQLSISEEEFLETVFNFLLARDTHKANTSLNSLKNGDWEELLKELPKNAVINFAEDYLDMVEEDDIEECITLKEYDDDDLLNECGRRGFKVEKYDKINTRTF